ncbi:MULTISPECIES: PssD/Cps14F family polysaccharide biosynthesis glycosyltransferase [Chroococcidiopsis]|jgi:beta-1,4-N-acetylglucosaminyltransferase|uniref:Oligosaccharide biosynthesis protein Alg14 like protein n=1 Tax=Chroococcidiopsis thermalis (strain PCC 7203) TaxID=251229 RepID=K9TTZ7_CHRTP|nr:MULTISPECIES: PssD/Cps14F family polysaccharide biosynthesis glycosyltransferase [Chroococcidiopsis]AFY86282.1 Oligosaccharide biosynthesis protein Alg14 like protein [Chroococcidiopsis thermalis PCC 7203]PSB46043.1 UDP-N-acetylglucosamine--LPS N-acetylglucosamine transferase [Cyanosarcina cf. burmensis CCALA 770]URD51139.1 UDP-N-acetylglucosamine transferase subunit ALG14 [Chroococcidiopsis sp. CCNUC1]
MKLLLVCNPGGHFSTMMGLKSFWSTYEREWVTYRHYDTQKLSEKERVYWVAMQEARMLVRAFINFFKALVVLRQSKPDLVLSTGASIAVPFIIASKLYGIKTVFIESISRSGNLSLTGRIVYHLVDEFYVQWPECVERYPKAQYKGVVV